ncbi:MAG: hypothetical protein QF718_03725 [Phycisphaerales bacterium]|jgi:hypothetical protein|nr:hypothetical protein [Phycisphaerales bacterium]
MNQKIKKIWQQITADRRRFGLFCTLLLVGLLLWARIIVIARPPRTAVATPTIEETVSSIITSDKISIPVLLETEPFKNPFAVSVYSFPDQSSGTDNTTVQHTNAGFSDEQSLVSLLELDAVMGEIAMIDGRVVRIGDIVGPREAVEPLRLSECNGRTVIISAGDRRYELSIAHPTR